MVVGPRAVTKPDLTGARALSNFLRWVLTMRRAKGDPNPELDEAAEEQEFLKKQSWRKRAFMGDMRANINTVKRGKKGKPKKVKPKAPPVEYLEPTWVDWGTARLYWPGVKESVVAVCGVEGSWIADVRLPTGGIRTIGPVTIREDCQAKGLEMATRYWGNQQQFKIAV